MRLYAFEGLRYAAKAGDPAGDPAAAGRLAAPPYDQIDERSRDRFHAVSPAHFVHLTQPVPGPSGSGLDAYQHAAALHAAWLAQGAVARDSRPALYPYVIALAEGGHRLGVMGRVELAAAHEIRPHEHTLDKPFADRLALLKATQVDLEPVFLLAEDGGQLNALIGADIAGQAPLVDHLDADGHHHLLYRVDDPARIAQYGAALAVPSAIADGHHRYKVAQRFAEETGALPGSAAATKLAVVTSLDSPALAIDPIHRALARGVDLDALAAATTTRRRAWTGTDGNALAAAVAAAAQPALGVWTAGRAPEIWHLDPAKGPAHLPAGARDLAVLLLHELVFRHLGLAADAATDGTVIYRSDPAMLYKMLAGGEVATGFWLPPMQPQAFAAAIAQGDMLPPKSTRFLPKVMSGLVWGDQTSRLL